MFHNRTVPFCVGVCVKVQHGPSKRVCMSGCGLNAQPMSMHSQQRRPGEEAPWIYEGIARKMAGLYRDYIKTNILLGRQN
jgi:hypothetical protein